ncbi:HAD family hydrolase [Nocardioides sp. Y6]|uniref:HAD family hydrolase n=1 Tax=Nocardioides malaquae TaxID=2773426 RepID=A0ABR9RPC1_9ACTN|nr:HAD family hydrolase [Nocardioides malaquae]MBE7323429.1 HAD family hydrolase [Nocardioides malaquae]
MTSPSSSLTTRPEALLLDFGGVVFQTRKRPEAMAEFAQHVAHLLARAGHLVPTHELEEMLRGGKTALKDWKNSSSRRLHPRELDHREIWRDFYASPLPPSAREVLVGEAGELQEWIGLAAAEHTVRPGIPALLDLADELGIPVGIVSNAHSGRAHRRLMEQHGLAERFGVQVYSDEVGIRKPNPAMIELAANALGTTAPRTWYVGDTFDRDVVCGRRAGVAAMVLTRHHSTDRVPFPVTDVPDAVLDTPEGLVDLLRATEPGTFADPQRSDPQRSDPQHPDAIRAEPPDHLPGAILLDHGGVISSSTKDTVGRTGFAHDLAAGLRRAGWQLADQDAEDVVAETIAAHKKWKQDRRDEAEAGTVLEIDPTTFWVDLAGPHVEERVDGDARGVRAWLRAEAYALSIAWARVKSISVLRPGVKELCEAAAAAGVPIGIVSNTVSGRSVREKLAGHGIGHLVAAGVYSDELGRRKPDAVVATTACRALGVDPARAVFVGDKPENDVVSARGGGVGTAVIVRGGSTADARIDALLADPGSPEHPDLVVAEMDELIDVLNLRP